MTQPDTHDWDEFLKARNELEAANEYHIGLLDRYTSSTNRPGQPLKVATKAAKAEIEAAEERLDAARDRMRLAQSRLR
jgi:hypothetical protein